MNILTHFHKNNRQTGILTNGHFFAARDISILNYFLQHLLAGFRFFSGERMAQSSDNIFAQNCISLDEKFFYRFSYALGIYPPQSTSVFFLTIHI